MNNFLDIEKSYENWSIERVSRHILYWATWTIFYMTVNANYNDGNYWNWLWIELYVVPVKWVFTYFVIYFLMPRFFFTKKYIQFFLLLLPSAFLAGMAMRYIDITFIYERFFDVEEKYMGFWSMKISYKMLDLVYIAALISIIKLIQHNKKQEKKHQELMEQRLGAELQLLKNQLHPHFLFNTLNNLYGMVLTQEANAADVVIRLSDMMSYMLYECDVPRIELNKEVNHLKNYIELEKIRYKDRLDLSFEVAGTIDNKKIAPLLLLPFIENAFKHSAAKEEKQTWININLWVKEGGLSFKIENSLPNEYTVAEEENAKTQSGIGLQNVRKRLELLYPNQHELSITSADTFLVQLDLKID